MKEYFIFYTRNLCPLMELTDEELGQLFRIIMQYHCGEEISVPHHLRQTWLFLLMQFQSSDEKYQQILQKKRMAALKRWGKLDLEDMESDDADECTCIVCNADDAINKDNLNESKINEENVNKVKEKKDSSSGGYKTTTTTTNFSSSLKSASTSRTPLSSFTPPTAEEVARYASERGLTIDTARFIDYYEGRGWLLGKVPMRDWRSTLRNWARRGDHPPGGARLPSRSREDIALRERNRLAAEEREREAEELRRRREEHDRKAISYSEYLRQKAEEEGSRSSP